MLDGTVQMELKAQLMSKRGGRVSPLPISVRLRK